MAANEPDPTTRILGLGRLFLRQMSAGSRLLVSSALCVLFFCAALLARVGTGPARFVAGAAVITGLLVALALTLRRFRRQKEPEYFLHTVLAHVSDSLSGRARRAFALWKRLRTEEHPKESPELAELHLERVLAEAAPDVVRDAGRRVGRRRFRLALGFLAVALGFLFFRPVAVLEGVDVLLARRGVGPYPINYVARLQVTAQWPSYLDGSQQRRFMGTRFSAVPAGTEIEVRVIPVLEDRKLFLTDGLSEVAFLSDGKGALIARWQANDPSELRVAARFGDVLLYDAETARLNPVDDRAPGVVLVGAPAERQLEDVERLALSFYAHDDHGLSQIDLVVSSGQRTERQELVHLDGTQRMYRGGHSLTREHELLKKAFLPVRVRIEARDGNVATGPSWGRSKEIVLFPKPLGKDVADRHVAFRAFRKELSGFLAATMDASKLGADLAPQRRRAAFEHLMEQFEQLEGRLAQIEGIPRNSLLFVRAQVEALEKAGAERAAPEAVLLAVDSLIQRIAYEEAVGLAKDLGAAVEELAVQARELRFHAEGVRRQGLFDLLEGVEAGATQLREVGTLGLDLGSVARADLGRISRSLEAKEYERAEGAAIHLAERLKRANSSFSAKGGAGVESGTPSPSQGGGQPQRGGPGEGASQAPDRFAELTRDIDQLAQENAAELSQLERLLQEAARAAARDFEKGPDFDRSLDELRRALSDLPATGYGPGSPRSEAAQGRAEGEAMADALEGGNFDEAIERGENARSALERAERLAERLPGWLDSERLERAQEALEKAFQDAREAAKRMERGASERQKEGLGEGAAARRDLADRARELAQRARNPEAPLPKESISALERAERLLRQAEQSLREGNAESGLEYSEQAQTQLERALPRSDAQPTPEGEGGQDSGGLEGEQSTHGNVPEEERDRAREFRDRVERGLSRGAGHLAPAVRRYAEELK